MTAPESLQTARLLLRKPRPNDAAVMSTAYGRDREVTRDLTWHPHTDLFEAEVVIKRFLARWQHESEYCWMIFDSGTEELIGSIAARREQGGFNLGFVLARRWWGRGLMPEAIEAVMRLAFRVPSVAKVSAFCDVENRASARALEKSGFTKRGLLRAHSLHPNIFPLPRECYFYSMIRETDA